MIKQKIQKILQEATGMANIELEIPPSNFGDFAFPCFDLAKKLDKNPNEVALDLEQKIKKVNFINSVKARGPYLNFFVNYNLIAKKLLSEIFNEKESFGKQNIGKNKVILIDFSSPNIAKPLGIGHLRSTVIGNSLYKIFKVCGYKVVGINHLGDWGTQFGKLLFAFNKWGSKSELKKDPIKHLFELYVKFHQEAKMDKSLEDLAREEFKKLESKDKKSLELWKLFRELSLQEFKKAYTRLNIKFDSYNGEAYYNSKTQSTMNLLKKKINTKISDGALIVDLDEFGMPPFFVAKSNGTSSYGLRDLSAAIDRLSKYKPEKVLYVTGVEQKLHFEQLFKVLDLIKMNNNKFFHVDFGRMSFADGKMSTREGKMIFLEEVLDKSIELSKKIMQEKKSEVKKIDDTAKKIGIGAVIFNDLSVDRSKNVVFDWNKILAFDGETGPYLQYTYVRCQSILSKAKKDYKVIPSLNIKFNNIKEKEELELVKQFGLFKDVLVRSMSEFKPNYLANYLIDLAKSFNEFYNNCKVLSGDNEEMKKRILLVKCAMQILENGLNLLGIEVVDKM